MKLSGRYVVFLIVPQVKTAFNFSAPDSENIIQQQIKISTPIPFTNSDMLSQTSKTLLAIHSELSVSYINVFIYFTSYCFVYSFNSNMVLGL